MLHFGRQKVTLASKDIVLAAIVRLAIVFSLLFLLFYLGFIRSLEGISLFVSQYTPVYLELIYQLEL
jgi:hypothetical protein